jgi:hypothetical protein
MPTTVLGTFWDLLMTRDVVDVGDILDNMIDCFE